MMQNTISTLPLSVTGRLKHRNWHRKCDCLPNSLYEKGIQQVFQLEKVGGYPIGIVPYIISKNIIVLVLSSLHIYYIHIYIHIFLIFQYYKYIYPFVTFGLQFVGKIHPAFATADFFITFFASKKAATDGHRAEFSEEELQVRGGPFRWGPQILSGCGNKLANSEFEFFWFICSILFSN